MRRTLPTCPNRFRPAIAFLAGCFVGVLPHAWGADPVDEEEEPVVEVVKQLVFIEQHLAEAGVIDGIESPYDVRVSPDGGHVYLASLKNDAVSYFTRDEANGELAYGGYIGQAEIGSNVLDGARSLAISPDGEFVYAASMFANSLATFERDLATGDLSFVDAVYDTDGGVDGLDGARSVVISPDGKNLYVAAFDDGKLSVFSRNATTGAADFLGVYKEGDQGVEELTDPHALAFSPDGRHLYVALWRNIVVTFSRDQTTGLLTYVGKLAYLESSTKKDSPRGIAVSPDGKFAYVVSSNNDALSVFSRDNETGELTWKANVLDSQSAVKDLDGPHAISISSDGKFIYVAAFSSDSVTSFERDATTGAVKYYQSIKAGAGDSWDMNGPISIGTSPDGEHVYVGSGSGAHSLVTFRREVIVDPPEFVVQPMDQSIEEGESVAFHALAQGVELRYQWMRGGASIAGEVLPVFSIDSVSPSDGGSEFSVRVSNAGGTLTSSVVTLTVLPPVEVEAPADLTALDISSSSARLVWADKSDNETNFEIQRRIPGGVFANLATVLADQIQYDDASLQAANTYIYRVRAKRGENVSLWSNDAVIESYDDVPRPPVNLTIVTQSYNRVRLRWSDRSAVEDGFKVARRPDEAGASWTTIATVDKNASEYVDRGVDAESVYAYRVSAFNESGESDYSNSVVALTSEIPVESITPVSRPIPRDSISGYSIGVVSAKEWEAISSVDWLIVTSPTGGQGTGNQGVTYRSRLNESQNERVGKMVVGGLEHTVVQEGSPPFLRVSPSKTEATAKGGTKLVTVQSNMNWSASEASDWVSILSGQSGIDYGTVVLSLLENTGYESRSAELTINSVTHVIEQIGKVPVLELAAAVSRFDSEGGSSEVSVSSNIDWMASVSEPWISLPGGTTGSGDGKVTFSVETNETDEVRTADILVNDKAITVTQDAAIVSFVAAPEWVRATVGPLGVELVWLDNSDSELGFRLRRSEVGGDRIWEVAEMEAGTTTYFDRDAPRGKELKYSLVAFDGAGESEEVIAATDVLPSANMTAMNLRVEAADWTNAFLGEILLAGEGEVVLQREGFGTEFYRLAFGCSYPVARYKLDSDSGQLRSLGIEERTEWEIYFSFEKIPSLYPTIEGVEGLRYAASTAAQGGAYPRGARSMGQLLQSNSAMVVGFEIEGDIELPVLLQAVGRTLGQKVDGAVAGDLRLELYAISETGSVEVVAENSDWRAFENEASISVENALRQTKGIAGLSDHGGEARLLLMLDEGRYVAVLRSGSGSQGTALLEVLDAR